MNVLIYEHVTDAGRLGEPCGAYPESVQIEGAAMRAAVAADFRGVPAVEVIEFAGRGFDECVATADAVLLIAPESEGVAAALARRVERSGKPLLSPSSTFCDWAGDKSATADLLTAYGVPMPRGGRLATIDSLRSEFGWPRVLKPNDGCGSQGVEQVDDVTALDAALRRFTSGRSSATTRLDTLRIEEYVEGEAVSVALLSGPSGIVALPACRQKLADDGTLAYLGGSTPLPTTLAARAEALAMKAAAAMPTWRGYIGVDLVLGSADDGSRDFLIEVNPRVTTSYVGLRMLAASNLAEAMLDVAAGRPPRLDFRPGEVRFTPDGTATYRSTGPSRFAPAGVNEACTL